MSLLVLSKSVVDIESRPKTLGLLTGQVMFATYEGNYHTPWTDIAVASAIADKYDSRRYEGQWHNKNRKHDDWGRIKRTELWG